MRRVLNIDGDTDERFYTLEADGESMAAMLSRNFGASKQPAAPVARLLNDKQAAIYLGVSRSALRAFVANGNLPRVQLPSTDGRKGRAARVLRIDVEDLNRFVQKSKG